MSALVKNFIYPDTLLQESREEARMIEPLVLRYCILNITNEKLYFWRSGFFRNFPL